MIVFSNSNKTWFYIIGFGELILLIAALITAIIEKRKEKALAAEQTVENPKENTQE